jgi:hypothetical protein
MHALPRGTTAMTRGRTQTIGAPYVTYSVESFPCDAAADLASWAECTLADLELPDTASVDDVCDVLNQEGW